MMGIIKVGICPHYDCSNRDSFGYCKTTVCINEHYKQEQWVLPAITNKDCNIVIKHYNNSSVEDI